MTSVNAPEATPLTERILQCVDQGEVDLPPLPELATRIVEMLDESSDAGAGEVAELLRNDPAVAATLLKIANSAAYGGLRQITALHQAVARLGLHQVASIVTALLHRGHYESRDPARRTVFRALWDHAVASAMAARMLAGVRGGDPEESFMAGLLHDVGKLVVLEALDHLTRARGVTLTPDTADELVQVLHAELGHRTLTAWKLPEPVCRAALRHHDEDVPADDALLVRVQAADAIARKLGAHASPDPELDLMSLPAFERLDLGDVELAALLVDLEDQLAELKELF